MKQFFLEQWVFFVGIMGALLVSSFCQIFIIYYMLKMVNASEKLEEEKQAVLGEWIEEYISEKQKIGNVTIFINKKLQHLSWKKYKITGIKHLSGQMLLLAVFLAGVGACKGIIEGKTLGQILPFYILSLFGMYLHFSLAGVMDLEGKKKVIQMNLTDFLENGKLYLYMPPREQQEKEVEEEKSFFGEQEDKELREIIREILA